MAEAEAAAAAEPLIVLVSKVTKACVLRAAYREKARERDRRERYIFRRVDQGTSP